MQKCVICEQEKRGVEILFQISGQYSGKFVCWNCVSKLPMSTEEISTPLCRSLMLMLIAQFALDYNENVPPEFFLSFFLTNRGIFTSALPIEWALDLINKKIEQVISKMFQAFGNFIWYWWTRENDEILINEIHPVHGVKRFRFLIKDNQLASLDVFTSDGQLLFSTSADSLDFQTLLEKPDNLQ